MEKREALDSLMRKQHTFSLRIFFDGIVVKLQIKGIKILKETDETIEVQVGAGEIRDNFVKHCIENHGEE